METIRLIYSKSKLPLSPLIQMVTWSEWSHVGILVGDTVIESTWSHGGVKETPLDVFLERSSDWIVKEYQCHSRQAIIDAARTQIGKPYDKTGLVGILMRDRNWQEDDSWFCSELIAWAFAAGGTPLFMLEDGYRITPQNIYMLWSVVVDRKPK